MSVSASRITAQRMVSSLTQIQPITNFPCTPRYHIHPKFLSLPPSLPRYTSVPSIAVTLPLSLQSLHHPLSMAMAATSHQSLPHPFIIRRPHHPTPLTDSLSFTLFLKPAPPQSSISLSVPSPFSISSSSTSSSSLTTNPSSSVALSFDLLQRHLSSQNFRLADEETRRLLIVLAGDAALKRGYVFFSEVQFIPEADLKTIDSLWLQSSGNKFGYSVQKRIWEKKAQKDFTKFFLKVGWMKKLDTEVEQYNYRSFPDEFIWELKDDTPEGHLPLTNALRGTQLLNSILTHPAFDSSDEEESMLVKGGDGSEVGSEEPQGQSSKPVSKRIFKTDYSF